MAKYLLRASNQITIEVNRLSYQISLQKGLINKTNTPNMDVIAGIFSKIQNKNYVLAWPLTLQLTKVNKQ